MASSDTLLMSYGAALDTRNGALFVGSGLSKEAGFPLWDELLAKPRNEAQIPEKLTDLALVAEYYVRSMAGGRERLENHLLETLVGIPVNPQAGHRLIARLPLREVWTTNFDNLLEAAMPMADVIAEDDDLKDRRSSWERRIIKMHGSLSQNRPSTWLASPVITRGDYEQYEVGHQRIWHALTATFLTQSFLFLGFSFADPNVEVLLRLARNRLNLGAPEHYTIFRRPDDPTDRKLHELRAADLEASGIEVIEITEYSELEPILRQLVRRTRPPRLFLSGSHVGEKSIYALSESLGIRLAGVPRLEVASLAGEAAMEMSYAMGFAMRARGEYDGERIRLYFRQKKEPPPALRERIGTVFYTDKEVDELRQDVLRECRAIVVVGGGNRTASEVRVAEEEGLAIIPLGTAGGTARHVWETMSADADSLRFGGQPVDEGLFRLLADDKEAIAVDAALQLIKQALFLNDK